MPFWSGSRSRTLDRMAACCILVLAVSGCARSSDSGIETTAPAQASAAKAAASPQWAREGERLRQYKADKNQENAGKRRLPGNADDFAYQSQPIDIVKEGQYVLLVKVPADFDFPRSPTVIAVNYPDDSLEHFALNASGPIAVRGEGEGRIVELPVSVSELRQPYPGYSVWIY